MAIPYARTIVGSLPWYSVLIVTGILLAVWLASKEERRLGLEKDTSVDLALVAVPCGIVGARLYYVAMRWEVFAQRPVTALYIWQGGLAIYGAVLGGALGLWLYARHKNLAFATIADLIAPGLLLAQAIGRWGNYFNSEAYGPRLQDTRLWFFPIGVLIPSGEGYVWHAATFFYESLWNFCGFWLLWGIRKKQRQPGNVFAWYLVIYGSGRFIIEQLREDSLYLGSMRVSQGLSLLLCAAAAWVLIRRRGRRHWPLSLLCAGLWLARWACLEGPVLYALLLLTAGILAIWQAREERGALGWLMAALLLDGAGLTMAIMGWPLSAEVALGIHTALCSLTFPLGLMALTSET